MNSSYYFPNPAACACFGLSCIAVHILGENGEIPSGAELAVSEHLVRQKLSDEACKLTKAFTGELAVEHNFDQQRVQWISQQLDTYQREGFSPIAGLVSLVLFCCSVLDVSRPYYNPAHRSLLFSLLGLHPDIWDTHPLHFLSLLD